MLAAQDKSGRLYEVIEITSDTTLLRCIDDKTRVRIPNEGWDKIGFKQMGAVYV